MMRVAEKIEHVSIDSLKPYEKNARLHSPQQIAKLAASITEFGFTNPVLVDSLLGVIAGHGRIEAARRLGLKELPVIKLSYLSDAQKRALVIADNRLAEDARWDFGLLKEELAELDLCDFDLDKLGFSDSEIDALLVGDIQDIEEPEPRFTKSEPKDAEGSSSEADCDAVSPELYTKRVKAPIYEPKGEQPAAAELFATAKTDELLAAISAAKVPDEVREFLRLAAYRHTVFDFQKIAEFYAHAPKETQRLMESSALVIVDFNQAIENGFVRLTHELAEAYASDDEDDAEAAE